MNLRTTILSIVALTAVAAQAAHPDQLGTFDVPAGQSSKGPALPGQAYEFDVTLGAHDRLNLSTMYGASNDWFFSSGAKGIKVVNQSDRALTKQVYLYDAGTEVDENPAVAEDSGPTQSMPDEGYADPVNYVRSLSQFSSLEASKFLKLRSVYLGKGRYRIRLEVLSSSPTPLSPGVFWVTRKHGHPPFMLNHPAMDNGLEELAEDGDNIPLYEYLKKHH